MNKLSQERLISYQRRKSKKEKTAFINLLKQQLPIEIEQSGRTIKSRNPISDNIEKAKIILSLLGISDQLVDFIVDITIWLIIFDVILGYPNNITQMTIHLE